ncbi:hypothetical protein Pint_18501 [Pistacia integerrima]|uniref:Uncharacterized protein n=2 Tax=Pistacia TaxID=55512 RepID=A0ACC0YYA6_9ROSI|nr:hypothetical protein Pint_18501 [Pistacia integerrima]
MYVTCNSKSSQLSRIQKETFGPQRPLEPDPVTLISLSLSSPHFNLCSFVVTAVLSNSNQDMDPEAARTARESLDLAFHMSNILDTGLDRHTLSILIALCDLGLNPEALAAVVKELRREPSPSSTMPTAPS